MGESGRVGESAVGGGDGWEARSSLCLSIGLFGASVGPRSASHKPRQACRV